MRDDDDGETKRLRRRARRLRQELDRRRRRVPAIPVEFSRPDPCIGRVVLTGVGGDGFFAFGKVEELEYFAPFVFALLREGIECVFVTDAEAAVEAAAAAGTVVVHVYHEVRGEHRLLRDVDRQLPGALIFNPAALGPKLARKDRTHRILTRAGVPMPRLAGDLPPDRLVFSHARRGSNAPARLEAAGAPLAPDGYRTEFIDTRRFFRGTAYHCMIRATCVGREVVRTYVRIRPASDGSPSVHASDVPFDPEAVAHFREVLIPPRLARIRDLSRRIADVIGPGFYSHDMVAGRDGGELLVVESGMKFTDMASRLRPVAAFLPAGYVPFMPVFARDSAMAFLRECRRLGYFGEETAAALRRGGGAP